MTGRRAVAVAAMALAAALLPAPARAAERSTPPAVGETAPEVSLRDQNGRPFVLHDVLKEREFVVLAFYPKAFTSG